MDNDIVTSIEVRRDDLATSRLAETTASPSAGQIVARVDRFAITANNITYANLGETAGYWRFFAASEPGWGVIPAWGDLTVEHSGHRDVEVGTRLYGFVPMASHVVVTPDRVRPSGLVDAAVHRTTLPAAYNYYATMPAPPDAHDDLRPVLAPVFMLSFLLDDEVAETAGPDERVLITSASAKAAIGTAHLLHARSVPTTGVTSAGNAAFCNALACYDDVITYDRLDGLDARPTTVVDIAGNARHTATIERTLGPLLRRTIAAGLTQLGPNSSVGLDDVFSAPDRIVHLTRQWGRSEFDRRVTDALRSFTGFAARWLTIDHLTDPTTIREALDDTRLGTAPPDRAILATLERPSTAAR